MKEVLEKITLGILKSLEQQPGVTNVKMMDLKPADQSVIDAWEQKYMCKLPMELKNFYLTTDGMLIQWSITFKGSIMPLGRMEVNPIASLTKFATPQSGRFTDGPSLLDIDTDEDETDEEGRIKPHFDERNRIYELDSCNGNGKVCLVYKDLKAGFTTSKPEIWFLDRSLQWSFLSDNFVNYFRMMMIHLGLPNWLYLFTKIGLSPETKFWFHLYAPDRLALEANNNKINTDNVDEGSGAKVVKINPQRLFKGKSEKKKAGGEQGKTRGQGTVSKTRPSGGKHLKSASRLQQR
ncbi:tubulin polyglutamylase complex subunit 2-like [Rhopilema esculentum]|uniref:tubulin polyglutamylase complex subunit 2-like n=1 Tax=Rhopilema esculentum TaxID=499914 RepID=UPI0031E007A4